MTVALATSNVQPLATFSNEQRDLIKRTVAPEATNDELAMFLHVAAKSGLDPLQKQIWFVKRSGRVTIQAGIDGLQARAAREPDYEGMIYGVVCAKDDFQFDAKTGQVEKHIYNPFADRGPTMGAWCIVRRKGMLPFTAMVRFSEYNQGASPLWREKPQVMIEKVARSTALRRAYPEALSGIYAPEEMGDKAQFMDEEDKKAVEAPVLPSRAQEAKRVEAEVVPPEVLPTTSKPGVALLERAQKAGKTFKEIRHAAVVTMGKDGPPAPLWTEEQTKKVEATLFPPADAAEPDIAF